MKKHKIALSIFKILQCMDILVIGLSVSTGEENIISFSITATTFIVT